MDQGEVKTVEEEDEEEEEKSDQTKSHIETKVTDAVMEKLIKSKIRQKPNLPLGDVTCRLQKASEKKYISPYLQYLLARSDRSTRHFKKRLLKMKDGDTKSMGTLESVLHVRQRTKTYNRDNNKVGADTTFPLKQNQQLSLPPITKAKYDEAGACAKNIDDMGRTRKNTFSLLSRLNNNYAGNKNIEGALRIPCAPLKLPNNKTNQIRYRTHTSVHTFGEKNQSSIQLSKSNYPREAKPGEKRKKARREASVASFVPVLPVPKPPTKGEMPNLSAHLRDRKRKKTSILPSFVKEKFKLEDADFRIKYTLKRYRQAKKQMQ